MRSTMSKKIQKENAKLSKEKESIRIKTRHKYGKLPKGYQYHHTTIPYDIDIWIGILKEEHYKTLS